MKSILKAALAAGSFAIAVSTLPAQSAPVSGMPAARGEASIPEAASYRQRHHGGYDYIMKAGARAIAIMDTRIGVRVITTMLAGAATMNRATTSGATTTSRQPADGDERRSADGMAPRRSLVFALSQSTEGRKFGAAFLGCSRPCGEWPIAARGQIIDLHTPLHRVSRASFESVRQLRSFLRAAAIWSKFDATFC